MEKNFHTHPCTWCATPVGCNGTLSDNYDGWPTVVCDLVHLDSGITAFVLCVQCEAEFEQRLLEDEKENV